MRIQNVYIVHIDLDGDIAESKYCWGQWLVLTELEEVKKVIIEALNDIIHHQKEHDRDTSSLEKIVMSSRLLKKHINSSGIACGNWKINIYKSE